MPKNLDAVAEYICTHKANMLIASVVMTIAVGVFVFDKEFKISLLPRTPAN